MTADQQIDSQGQQESNQPWQDFQQAESEEEYLQAWLNLQAGLLEGVLHGLLVIRSPQGDFQPIAVCPAESHTELLAATVDRVVERQLALLVAEEETDHFSAAYPVFIDQQLYAVVAFAVQASGQEELARLMEQLQWGTAWLELLVRRRQLDADQALLRRLQAAVDLLSLTLDEQGYSAASLAFVTELAAACDCERVSFGYSRHGRDIRLDAVSHSAEVGKKMNLTKAIERVMEESLLQGKQILYPPSGQQTLIDREHEALSRQQAMAAIATFPLFHENRYCGALTCERGANKSFTSRDVEFIEAVLNLAGPVLIGKLHNEQGLLSRLSQSAINTVRSILGSSHLGLKLLLLTLAAAVGLTIQTTTEYRLTAQAKLEGAVRRAVVVPFDGYIHQAAAAAGDQVKAGDLLCALDERELRLEKLAKLSRFKQLERQLQEAVARHDRAQVAIIKAQLEQAQAELDLLDSKLQRTRLTAPFDGLLVSGDLSQQLGGAVAQGEVLFEITPLDNYRLILQVDERRIADVQPGQEGKLVLSALPQHQFEFRVTKLTPVARAEEGRNYFRVEGSLTATDEKLRPGMEGIAKISIDSRSLAAIWTRELVEWLQLASWQWRP